MAICLSKLSSLRLSLRSRAAIALRIRAAPANGAKRGWVRTEKMQKGRTCGSCRGRGGSRTGRWIWRVKLGGFLQSVIYSNLLIFYRIRYQVCKKCKKFLPLARRAELSRACTVSNHLFMTKKNAMCLPPSSAVLPVDQDDKDDLLLLGGRVRWSLRSLHSPISRVMKFMVREMAAEKRSGFKGCWRCLWVERMSVERCSALNVAVFELLKNKHVI